MLLLTPTFAFAQEPRRVTFDEAVGIALTQSSAIARAENQTTIDRLAVSDARMRFVPDLRFSTSGSRSFGSGGVNAGYQSLNAGVSSSVVLFDGLSNVANLRGAELGEKAGALDAERTREDVVFAMISGYLTLIEAGEQRRVAEENLAAQEARERDVRVLVDRGSRPVADLYQQESSVASARSSMVEAQRAQELAEIGLVQTLRLDPAGDYVFEAPSLPQLTAETAAELDVDALIERTLSQRADIAAMDTRVAASEQTVRAAQGAHWPTVSLSAGYGSSYSSLAEAGFGDQLDAARGGSVGLSVSFPLFDGLSTRRAVERAAVEADNTRLAAEDARQQVALEVTRAVLDRRAAVAQLEAAQARVIASRQALDATEARYSAGVATQFEVTQARTDFVDATSGEVRARYTLMFQDRVLAYYSGDLDASLGD